MINLTVKNFEVVAVIKDTPKNELDARVENVCSHILEQHIGPVNSIVRNELIKKLKSSFFNKFNDKWGKLKRGSRNFDQFEKAYHVWMNCSFKFETQSDETESAESK